LKIWLIQTICSADSWLEEHRVFSAYSILDQSGPGWQFITVDLAGRDQSMVQANELAQYTGTHDAAFWANTFGYVMPGKTQRFKIAVFLLLL
jgi:hypothetical protein